MLGKFGVVNSKHRESTCAEICRAAFLLMIAIPLYGSQPWAEKVECCAEARAFLRRIRPEHPISVGNHLFIDDGNVAALDRITRTLHRPAKVGTVIRADEPWEGTIQTRTGPSWDPDAKRWMIWYFASGGTAYATSKDGIQWHKPILGIREYKGSKENNLLGESLSFVFYDATESNPAYRYKAMAEKSNHPVGVAGFVPAVSPDGLHWTLLSDSFIPSQDEANLYYDRDNHLFIFTVKHPGPYGRSVYLALSRDFQHWTDPQDCLIFHADHEDQELGRDWISRRFSDSTMQRPEYNIPQEYSVQVYNMAVFHYDDLYLGLPAMFHQTGRVSKDWDGFDRLKLSADVSRDVHLYGDWTGFHHLQLLVSRNLIDWERVGSRQPFIDASPVDTGAYDLQVIMPGSSPIVREDEIWFYYSGIRHYAYITSDLPDQGGICLAKLRRDGFVSLDAEDDVGTVLTKPVVVKGKLQVNIDASKGELRCEVVDPSTRSILPGYSLENSTPVRGDYVTTELQWHGKTIAQLSGRTVQLRFRLHNARLYSFRL